MFSLLVIASLVFGANIQVKAQAEVRTPPPPAFPNPTYLDHYPTNAERQAAIENNRALGLAPGLAGGTAALEAAGVPHYFGPFANYANSPMPKGPIADITVDEGGEGYTAPVVTITDVYSTGVGATATATVVGGVITAINITNGGGGYTAPWVTIEDATGTGAAATATIGGTLSGGIRKFVDSLPGLGAANANNLGNYITVAIPDKTTFPGSDYYEIEVGQYTQTLHSDLPATTLRGYRQTNTTDPTVSVFSYLGPLIIAEENTPVRIKFTNSLPTGEGGDLFIPVDTTVMGAGMGPMEMPGMPGMMEMYTQNRATLHLHGGFIPWISDGTPHQWTTPAGEDTMYPEGVSVQYVPDMWYLNGNVIPNTVGVQTPPVPGATNKPGPGTLTFYYNNQQSARLMFYHDHSWGITRLNVYAGEAAVYLLTDEVEQDLINGTNNSGINPGLVQLLPGVGIPLIFQDKTFVDADTIKAQDPLWRWGTGPVNTTTGLRDPRTGDLWVPSIYMPAQNPNDPSGASAFGRWQYGPWFWPPTENITHPPVPNEYYDPACDTTVEWCEPPLRPDMPDPSMGMEAFMDTPLVNGTAYPYVELDPQVYRFRMLNAADDRFFNLHFYVADPSVVTWDGRTNTEVKMVPAMATPGFPATWSTDGREGGVPDPATAGPSWIQIGTEGGFLPTPVVIPPQPLNWNMNATAFNVGNVTDHSLLLAPAERADVLVDFSQFAGQTLILYNDAPAAFPALDPRYDYYTGNPPQMDSGGTPTTQPGYGPNIRTIMQVRIRSLTPTGDPLAGIEVTNGGSDYAYAPEVVFSGGGGTGAAATATASIDHITVLNPGSGYTSVPDVTVEAGAGVTATATAIVENLRVTGIVVTEAGSGYTTAPTVTISGGGGSGATALAALKVSDITLTVTGTGYTSAPMIRLLGGGGYDATARALLTIGPAYDQAPLDAAFASTDTFTGVFALSQDPIIIPQAAYNTAYNANFPGDKRSWIQQGDWDFRFFNGPVNGITLMAAGSGYTTVPTVTITGGGGTGAAATAAIAGANVNGITLLTRGSAYTSNPTVTLSGGGGTGARAAATITRVVNTVTVTNGGAGYTTAPTVRFNGGGGSGAAATATVSGGRVTAITVTNGGTGYTSAPTVSFVGGGGSGARATANMTGVVNSLRITNSGTGYSSAPTVTISGGGGTGATAVASILPGYVSSVTLTAGGTGYDAAPLITFTGGGGTGASALAEGVTLPLQAKAIQDEMGEAFDIDYGRMGGYLGVELPVTVAGAQKFTLYPYVSPPIEIQRDSITALGTLGDGTEIWKITHNGVDTHPIHFHLYNVQLINRVAWDGAILPTEPNELGWKETLRVNPLEHTIVAMRPYAPTQPFDIPNSIRPIDPSMPLGEPLPGGPGGFKDPSSENAPVINHLVNYGWEYVWHCHILSHEEMDMMHSVVFAVAPAAPSNLTAVYNTGPRRVTLTWKDNSHNETNFIVQRTSNPTGQWVDISIDVPGAAGKGTTITYEDRTVQNNRTYYYRVIAANVVGDTTQYAAPAIGYPNYSSNSTPTNPGVSIVTSGTAGPGTPFIFASNFADGLAGWAGVVGNVQANQPAAVGPEGGAMGMAAVIAAPALNGLLADGPKPAYVVDASPAAEVSYDASFWFDPNSVDLDDGEVDIFVGTDVDGNAIFGVELEPDSDDEGKFEISAWALFGEEDEETESVYLSDGPHQIEVVWQSGATAEFSLMIDGQLIQKLTGDSSATKLEDVFLGPSSSLAAGATGTMFFDEFASNRLNITTIYAIYLPNAFR